jgi:hypothetical protein
VKKTYTQIEYEFGDYRYWFSTSADGAEWVWIQMSDDDSTGLEIPVTVLQEMVKDLCLLNKPVEEEIPF